MEINLLFQKTKKKQRCDIHLDNKLQLEIVKDKFVSGPRVGVRVRTLIRLSLAQQKESSSTIGIITPCQSAIQYKSHPHWHVTDIKAIIMQENYELLSPAVRENRQIQKSNVFIAVLCCTPCVYVKLLWAKKQLRPLKENET